MVAGDDVLTYHDVTALTCAQRCASSSMWDFFTYNAAEKVCVLCDHCSNLSLVAMPGYQWFTLTTGQKVMPTAVNVYLFFSSCFKRKEKRKQKTRKGKKGKQNKAEESKTKQNKTKTHTQKKNNNKKAPPPQKKKNPDKTKPKQNKTKQEQPNQIKAKQTNDDSQQRNEKKQNKK